MESSLSGLCRLYLSANSRYYPVEALALLPKSERNLLVDCVPPVDLVRLEGTKVMEDLNTNR